MSESAAVGLTISPEFKGQLIGPGDPDYDRARAVYNASIDRRPALIVRPTGAADVADAVAYARSSGLPLVVKCGGHAVAGTSASDGGVLIDLSSLKGVHVDPQRGVAVAQAGVLWGEYDRETTLRGLATPGGRVTTTGLGGFTLGGGYGWLSRRHGLACDNLVGADVVTADGRLVHASETENADLLWGSGVPAPTSESSCRTNCGCTRSLRWSSPACSWSPTWTTGPPSNSCRPTVNSLPPPRRTSPPRRPRSSPRRPSSCRRH
ncbi:FAD-binding oxidoreductase [Raineyella fluvialis]|uniref:FAD-binding protein n=1 Tax=Raineyella fluvialis TaxID=2662261 RepID=A0A5Q2F8D3_9ACTN|nr:FAD-dependent oxidoreductase [Raineyella fluvialis]QGF22918.1 FAD-binding protein [Raineyella fluvialis]